MHLRCLEKLVDEFIGSEPYSIAIERWPDPPPQRGYVHYRVFVRDATPVTENIGLTAGDFLTNLRASLDHLAWKLVLASGGKPNEYTAFPVKATPPKSGFLKISGGVSSDAQTLIEKAQPYSRPDGVDPHEDRLWILERLVGIDKHRHLLLTITAYEGMRITGLYDQSHEFATVEPLTFETDAQIGVYAIAETHLEQVDVKYDFTTAVYLRKGEPGGDTALIPLFRRLLSRVRDEVVPSFDTLR